MTWTSDEGSMQRLYFFDDGLCFECTQCGACCIGDPGTIYISAREVTALGNHLKLSPAALIDQYLYPFKDSYSIREDERGRCLFFDNGCTIYPLRPHQCRTFPFWFHHLRSEQRWRQIGDQCPGIGQGRLYSKAEILTIAGTTIHF